MASNFKFLSERELQLIQFKAKQILLDIKENEAWYELCKKANITIESDNKNVTPEKITQPSKSLKEIGIQVQHPPPASVRKHTPSPRFASSRIEQKSTFSKDLQNLPAGNEEITYIKQQLESVRFNIAELQKKLHPEIPKDTDKQAKCSSENLDKNVNASDRKEFLQNAVRASLETMPKHQLFTKNKPPVKERGNEVGFLLPYILREERALARRRYLSSLVHPKTVVNRKSAKKKITCISSSTQADLKNERSIPVKSTKQNLKSNKKQTIKDDKDVKLENNAIDIILDKILDELFDEALFIPEINVKKKSDDDDNEIKALIKKLDDIEKEEILMRQKWENLLVKHSDKKYNIKPTSTQPIQPTIIIKLQNNDEDKNTDAQISSSLQIGNTEHLHKILNGPLENAINHTIDKTSFPAPKKYEETSKVEDIASTSYKTEQEKEITVPYYSGVKTELYVKPQTVENVMSYRKSFKRYLQRTSHLQERSFNPKDIMNRMADMLLDDCMEEIAKELQEIPSFLTNDLYNQEFMQSFI